MTNRFGAHIHQYHKYPENAKRINLKEDFYAAAFVAMNKEVVKKFDVTTMMQGRNFYAVLWIYLIELTLIAIILKSVVFD